MEKELLSFDEARELLGFSRSFLFKLMRENEVRYAKIRKRIVFRRSDIDAFIESKMVVPAEKRGASRKAGSKPGKK